MNTLHELTKEIHEDIAIREKSLAVRRAYAEGEHWQNKSGYAGIVGTEDKNAEGELQIIDSVVGRINNFFTPKGMFRDVCLNVRDSIIGEEPHWKFTGETDANLQELEEVFTRYVDRRNILTILQEAAFYLPWALVQEENTIPSNYVSSYSSRVNTNVIKKKLTSAPLRIYLPKKFLDANGKLIATDFEDALFKLRISAPNPEYAGVLLDDDNEPHVAYYAYSMEKEASKRNASSYATEYEVSMTHPSDLIMDEINKVLVGDVPENPTYIFKIKEKQITEAIAYPMQGKLHICDMRALPTVTDDMIRVQRSTDAGRTSLAINNSYNIPERIAENARPPGYFLDENGNKYNSANEVPEGTNASFVLGSLNVGSGATAFIQGLETFDSDGNPTGYTTPKYRREGPFDAKPVIEGTDAFIHDFYHQARQLHTIYGSKGGVSADYLVQLTTVFLASVQPHKTQVEMGFRWALESLRDLACHFSGETRFLEARASVEITPLTSILTSDDKRVLLDAKDKGVLSRETVQTRFGVSDVDAEANRIETEGQEEPDNESLVDNAS